MKAPIEIVIGNKVRRSHQVTCSKCGEKGHYHKTCKGAPKDSNWQSKTKKTKKKNKTQSGTSVGAATNKLGQQHDPMAKAKKNKKKMPKLKASPNVDFGEEISLSQSAPPNDGPATQQIPEPPVGFRMKQTIVRPPIPPTQNHLEPLGPATSGASDSLFTFMSIPGFRLPTNT
ncbi:uncharacterized protein LOC110265219 [Arachis ipaensis]|nr:uncharacterized protein LOC110265219 [Arachis ipaensis]